MVQRIGAVLACHNSWSLQSLQSPEIKTSIILMSPEIKASRILVTQEIKAQENIGDTRYKAPSILVTLEINAQENGDTGL